ncbi:MAG: hypothetical protein ACFFDT_08985 [Candidatus Hodarchaeota archaeon]
MTSREKFFKIKGYLTGASNARVAFATATAAGPTITSLLFLGSIFYTFHCDEILKSDDILSNSIYNDCIKANDNRAQHK